MTYCEVDKSNRTSKSATVVEYYEADPEDGAVQIGGFKHFQSGLAQGLGGAAHVVGILIEREQGAVKVDNQYCRAAGFDIP